MLPLVSVIIPCRNEEKTIHLVLEALEQQSWPKDKLEVVIADGLSEDGTLQEIEAFRQAHPQLNVRVVPNPQKNIPCGINVAIRASTGEFVVRMDAHSLPNARYVELSIADLQAGLAENVGGVWQIQPGASTPIARSIASAAGNPLGVGDAQYRFTCKASYVDTVPYGAYHRNLFDEIGFFNESLLSNEDYEFNTRIRQSGGRIWLNPEIRCSYFARPSLGSLSKQYLRYGFWKAQMLRLYPKTLRWRQLLPPCFVLGLLILLLVGIFWQPALYLLAAVLSLYLAALLLSSIRSALKTKDCALIWGEPLAIMTMHFCWAGGLIFGLFRKQAKKENSTQ